MGLAIIPSIVATFVSTGDIITSINRGQVKYSLSCTPMYLNTIIDELDLFFLT